MYKIHNTSMFSALCHYGGFHVTQSSWVQGVSPEDWIKCDLCYTQDVFWCVAVLTCNLDCHSGLVVKAAASRAEEPGIESRLQLDFFRVVIPVT